MKIVHLYHSGFWVELEDHVLLFDWYRGSLPPLAAHKQLLVFVSHSHPDHYNQAIWGLEQRWPGVRYVVHQDVEPARQGANILRVECGLTYQLPGLTVETLVSTDEGCAFLVQCEGRYFYHAGDLNWWHWEGEPDADNAWHESAFKEQAERLRGRHFDAVFLPLDPRQEGNAWWGFAHVLQQCTADHIFPMHYGDDRAAMLAYLALPQLAPWRGQIVTEECFAERKR